MILPICILLLIFCIILAYVGFVLRNPLFEFGVICIIFVILFGFLLSGTFFVDSREYIVYENFNITYNPNGAYVVLENGKAFVVTDYKDVEFLKSNPKELVLTVDYNAYKVEINQKLNF